MGVLTPQAITGPTVHLGTVLRAEDQQIMVLKEVSFLGEARQESLSKCFLSENDNLSRLIFLLELYV